MIPAAASDSSISGAASVTVIALDWQTYSDAECTTACTDYNSRSKHVYVRGTGLPTGTYRVAFYDGNGTLRNLAEGTAGEDGILNSDYYLNRDITAQPGDWHVLVQPSSGYTVFGDADHIGEADSNPTYDQIADTPETYGLLADQTITVNSEAIPELSNCLGAVGVILLSLGIYGWLRRRGCYIRKI